MLREALSKRQWLDMLCLFMASRANQVFPPVSIAQGSVILPLGRATAVTAQTAAAVLQELRTKAKLRGVAISPTSTGSKLQLSVALANNSLEVGTAAGKLVVNMCGRLVRLFL